MGLYCSVVEAWTFGSGFLAVVNLSLHTNETFQVDVVSKQRSFARLSQDIRRSILHVAGFLVRSEKGYLTSVQSLLGEFLFQDLL